MRKSLLVHTHKADKIFLGPLGWLIRSQFDNRVQLEPVLVCVLAGEWERGEGGQCCKIIVLHMNKLSLSVSAILLSLMCSSLSKNPHSGLICTTKFKKNISITDYC